MEGEHLISHLLQIEEAAAKTVADANTAAEKMLADAEREGRERFETEYKERRAELEEFHARQRAKLEAAYTAELNAYNETWDALNADYARFNETAARLLGFAGLGNTGDS